ncbi:nuclear pore membrane glycoprotein 210 [Epargyreus clarus]|uniref:nuclear pore membrane glycoprotein 210 n=1 Tax=Epargyreus clarus TaxID=520877 RepID=UPI003C2CCA49
MELLQRTVILSFVVYLCANNCESAKINTPRLLLPWFENLYVNFTFEIIEGGCYTWSLSRDDIIDIEPLYEDTWGHCSRAARVSVSKRCAPPGSVMILAEEVNTGEILRGDVDIGTISSLKVLSTTWKLFLEEAPEAFEVIAYDGQGNKFSTLEGVSFKWTIENVGDHYGEDLLVNLVRWRDTDYEAPHGVAELEAKGLRSHSVLLYGQAMGECRVTVCLEDICTDFNLRVVASVVLTPATAFVAPGDSLRYKVVRARAGRLTIQDVADTLYTMKVPDTGIALLEDTISLVKAIELGTTPVHLMSGLTEVASASLTVVEPHTIRVTLRPANLIIYGEEFTIHCVVFDKDGHALSAGQEMLIRLTVEGQANVDLLMSTENGTITEAMAHNSGPFTVTARLYSIAGRILSKKVEGQTSGVAIEPLQIVPPELFIAWTDNTQEIILKHRGGGDEAVTWYESEIGNSVLSLSPTGVVAIHGVGSLDVSVHLTKYPYIRAAGKVWSVPPEYVQVSSSGHARVGRAHHLHVALTAAHPTTGELYNFHTCNCGSFVVSLLEGPEPHNVTSAPWIQPAEGACCVLECWWSARGVSSLRISRGRTGDTARVAVRAAPALRWPEHAAALVGATLPVLAEGESLSPQSSEPRIGELSEREGPAPHKYPDVQLFTFKCKRKGDARLSLVSQTEEERESAEFSASCAPHVSRLRLEPPDTHAECSAGAKVWLRPGQEVIVKVSLFDAVGRELLDERGPQVAWEVSPGHVGIEFRATDRLFVEMDQEYTPVPVPQKYYQLVIADEQAIGWSGVLKASIPDATASIQAKVVAPLRSEHMKVILAWESETVPNITTVSGGSGRYVVEAPKGVSASVEGGVLSANVPTPGTYDLTVSDMCVRGESLIVEVNIEEVLSVEVLTARAVCAGGCVPIQALVKGVSHRYLTSSRAPEWRTSGEVVVKDGNLCGLKEGTGRVRASLGGVWSSEVEVCVFPALRVVPARARLPPGARLQLRHAGGPPPRLAALHYRAATTGANVEVSPSGYVRGLSLGTSRIILAATDIANVELATAEAEIEVVPISGLRVTSATQTLLVGSPTSVRVEAAGLGSTALWALQPPPRLSWTLRDPTAARLYTSHADDFLERSVAEGLSVRVVPLKPGVITLDVRVRNMGQVAETRTWDSTIEILGISDIRTSVDGLSKEFSSGDRLALAVGTTVRLKSIPRSTWTAYEDGAFEVKANGEVRALRPGFGVIVARHKDERNIIERESVIHVEVSVPHYCTAEPASSEDSAIRVVFRNSIGRELLAPDANVSVAAPKPTHTRRAADSALGTEIIISGLESTGALVSFAGTVGGTTVTDEVFVPGTDSQANRVVAVGSWAVCLEGVGWKAPPDVTLFAGNGVSLAVLATDVSAKYTLRLDRPAAMFTIHQVPVEKIEFLPGEWPSSLVPLSIEGASLTSGPLLCTDEQKYALEGVQVELPFSCRTKPPHTAQPVLDIASGQLGCSIIPAVKITEAMEIELCAEWGALRTCTRVLLMSPVRVSQSKVSSLQPPTVFTVAGHPQALKQVTLTPSPGLKLVTSVSDDIMTVQVKSETEVCGMGWVTVQSRLTSQELRVEVERECDVACGTLLGAIFSILRPYVPTLVTMAALAAAFVYVQGRYYQKSQIRMPLAPVQPVQAPSSPERTRTWSRSPYATRGPLSPTPRSPHAPVYGDASALPDNSFSPNSTRMHSRFL